MTTEVTGHAASWARLTPLAGLIVVAALTITSMTVALGRGRPHSLEDRVNAVAVQLKCTSCQAESVAASQSDIAQAMRAQIRDQLRAGRSPGQIKAWFAERYGQSVLLTPPARGPGLALWSLPIAALAAGVLAVGVVSVRRRGAIRAPAVVPVTRRGPPRSSRIITAALAAVIMAVAAIGVLPGSPWRWTTRGTGASTSTSPSTGRTRDAAAGFGEMQPRDAQAWLSRAAILEANGSYAGAARAYERALRDRPGDAAISIRLALVLTRAGRPRQALPLARAALRTGDHRADALLVLGLAERAAGDRGKSAQVFRQFLRIAPRHPAAPAIRRLLSSRG